MTPIQSITRLAAAVLVVFATAAPLPGQAMQICVGVGHLYVVTTSAVIDIVLPHEEDSCDTHHGHGHDHSHRHSHGHGHEHEHAHEHTHAADDCADEHHHHGDCSDVTVTTHVMCARGHHGEQKNTVAAAALPLWKEAGIAPCRSTEFSQALPDRPPGRTPLATHIQSTVIRC